MSDKLQLKEGDEVPFYCVQTDRDANPFALGAEDAKVKVRKLHVAGIYQTHFSEVDKQMVIGSQDLLQQVCGWDADMVSGLLILMTSVVWKNVFSRSSIICQELLIGKVRHTMFKP